MLNWKHIPIFIINRNRLTSLSRLIDWLLSLGCENIGILDNDSDYSPLLQYYEALPKHINLIKMGRNFGPYVFWELKFHEQMETPYIVTDSDVIPAEFCPNDIIITMLTLCQQFPDSGKVGPSLRLDNLSERYAQYEEAFKWESQFWHKPILRGAFSAPIDTTFAMYPPKAPFTNNQNNIRLGYPYLFEHTPWYVDENNLDEEEVHYRENTSNVFSNWSVRDKESWVKESRVVKNYDQRKRILHLGCGNEYIPGWINVDMAGRHLDIKFDLDSCANHALPIEDNSIDGFYMSHVLEHINDTFSLMTELYRIAKNNGKLFIRIPHGSSDDAWEDPTHIRAYFESSFAYFAQPAYSRVDYGYKADWQVDNIHLIVAPSLMEKGEEAAYQLIKTQRNMVKEMVVELTAVKPARQRLSELLDGSKITIRSDPRVAPNFS